MNSGSLKGPTGITKDSKAVWKAVPWRATPERGGERRERARSAPSQSSGGLPWNRKGSRHPLCGEVHLGSREDAVSTPPLLPKRLMKKQGIRQTLGG